MLMSVCTEEWNAAGLTIDMAVDTIREEISTIQEALLDLFLATTAKTREQEVVGEAMMIAALMQELHENLSTFTRRMSLGTNALSLNSEDEGKQIASAIFYHPSVRSYMLSLYEKMRTHEQAKIAIQQRIKEEDLDFTAYLIIMRGTDQVKPVG
jgi:hypothetical protein